MFRIIYITEKWNLGMGFFQVLTYCNLANFNLIKKYYWGN